MKLRQHSTYKLKSTLYQSTTDLAKLEKKHSPVDSAFYPLCNWPVVSTSSQFMILRYNRTEKCCAAHIDHSCQQDALNNIVHPESGITMPKNIVDNPE